jgi:hypothetical protein
MQANYQPIGGVEEVGQEEIAAATTKEKMMMKN